MKVLKCCCKRTSGKMFSGVLLYMEEVVSGQNDHLAKKDGDFSPPVLAVIISV